MAEQKKAPKDFKRHGWGGHKIFPTEVLVRDWIEDTDPLVYDASLESMNTDLKSQLWRERALDPEGLYRSNQAGTWHSKANILERTGDAGKQLWKMFGEGFTTYAYNAYGANPATHTVNVKMSAWAMIYSDRGYAAVHSHPNCHISGVYYVDSTFPDVELTMATGVRIRPGDIEFLDTRRGGEFQLSGMKLNTSAIFNYRDGRMLIFPSSLPHYVHPVRGEGERIVIACNATYTLKEKPK